MPLEADLGLTAMAMEGPTSTQGDETLLVRFFIHPKQDMAATEKEGRPIFVDTEYIEIRQPGNKDSIVRRPASEIDKKRFPEHYQKWKARTSDEEILEGTPLEQWPGISPSQIEELRYMNVRTVEQLAGMADANAQNFMGFYQLRERAVAYLEASKDQATAEEMHRLREQNNTLSESLHAMQARMNQMEEQLRKGGGANRESIGGEAAVTSQGLEIPPIRKDDKDAPAIDQGQENTGESKGPETGSRRRRRRSK